MIDGHDKFCPIWIVGDRIMTECECELINKVRVDMLDAAERAVTDVGFNFPFDIHDVPAYGKQVFAAIRALREEK